MAYFDKFVNDTSSAVLFVLHGLATLVAQIKQIAKVIRFFRFCKVILIKENKILNNGNKTDNRCSMLGAEMGYKRRGNRHAQHNKAYLGAIFCK